MDIHDIALRNKEMVPEGVCNLAWRLVHQISWSQNSHADVPNGAIGFLGRTILTRLALSCLDLPQDALSFVIL